MTSIVYAVIELAFLFGISIFFAAIAIDRKTLMSSALAAICWLVSGMLMFLFDLTGMGQTVAWIFFSVGVMFVFQLIYKMFEWFTEHQNARFEVAPL